jgi:hypothetical protein
LKVHKYALEACIGGPCTVWLHTCALVGGGELAAGEVELSCLDGSESKQRGRFATTAVMTDGVVVRARARGRRKGFK